MPAQTPAQTRYAVFIARLPNNYSGHIPDAPGRVATHKTREGVLRLLGEALALWLRDEADENRPAPPPGRAEALSLELGELEPGEELLWLEPAELNPASLALERLLRRSGLSRVELAGRMGVPPSAVSRLLNPFYWGQSLESLRRAAAILGASLELRFPPLGSPGNGTAPDRAA